MSNPICMYCENEITADDCTEEYFGEVMHSHCHYNLIIDILDTEAELEQFRAARESEQQDDDNLPY